MIRSFKSKKLKRFFEADDAAGLPSGQAAKIADILTALDTAKLTENWRLVFRFEDGDAFDVDLVDYH